MVEKIKTNVHILLFFQNIKKSLIFAKSIKGFYLLSKPKIVYLRAFFSTISQIPKEMVMYFGRKHVETELSCSHELATFIKHYMPLNLSNTIQFYTQSITYCLFFVKPLLILDQYNRRYTSYDFSRNMYSSRPGLLNGQRIRSPFTGRSLTIR